jgi:hypothetical protein
MDREESNAIALIALLQMLLIVLGLIGLGIVMKFHGYPDETVIRFKPLARFLHENGTWFFVMPFILFILCLVAEYVDRWFLSFRIVVFLCAAVTVVIPFLYTLAALDPITRPLFLKTGY